MFTLNSGIHFGLFLRACIIRSLILWKKSEALDVLGMEGNPNSWISAMVVNS